MPTTLSSVGSPTFASGKFGNAVSVSPSNYLRNIGGASVFRTSTAFTIEWWCKFSGSGFQFVFSSGSEWFGFSNGYVSSNANGGGNMSSATYNNNAWHHVAFTFTGSAESIYVDGTQVYAGSNSFTPNRFGADIYFGTQDGTNNNFTGSIDEMRLSNVVRYSGSFTAPTAAFSRDDNTLALWHFEADGTEAAYDTSSSSRFVRSSDLVSIVMANVKAPRSSVKTADYTLTLKDVGTVIEMNTANSNRVTVPASSSVSLPLGALFTITQVGVGRTNVLGGTGVTFDAPFGLALNGRYATIQLRQRALNEWVVTGSATEFIDVSGISGAAYRMRAAKQPYNDGDSVSALYPEVGSTVLSQATAASQPKWYSNGKNGKPYIAFDGVDDFVFNATGPTLSQPVTIAMAVQIYDSNGPKELIKMGGIEMLVNSAQNGGGRWAMYSGSSTDSVFQPGGVETFIGYFGMGGAGNGRAYTNGTLTSSNSIGNNSTSGDFYVGTHTSIARYAWMDVYEILVYNAALSASDIDMLNRYLRAYYQ